MKYYTSNTRLIEPIKQVREVLENVVIMPYTVVASQTS